MTDLSDRMLGRIPLSLTDKLIDSPLPAEARILRWCLYLQEEGENGSQQVYLAFPLAE